MILIKNEYAPRECGITDSERLYKPLLNASFIIRAPEGAFFYVINCLFYGLIYQGFSDIII